ncbi:MAG: hypothetical protein WA628_08460 [Terriglobales bacterium]
MSQQRKQRKQEQVDPRPADPSFLRKVIIGAVIVAALGATYYVGYHRRAHQYDKFAQCLTQRDVKMYGAYWCPHCSEQKAMFDAAFKYVTYIECGVPGTTSKVQQVCTDAGIKHFPTWQFPPMGERVEGAILLPDLSLRTGCPLP